MFHGICFFVALLKPETAGADGAARDAGQSRDGRVAHELLEVGGSLERAKAES